MTRLFFTGLFLLCLYSCRAQKLTGSWKFIEVYDGIIINPDTLKNKKNNSGIGMGSLMLFKNGSFRSMKHKGKYWKKDDLLKMLYSGDRDTVKMKISYIDYQYLLLSDEKNPKTWFYKKENLKGNKK